MRARPRTPPTTPPTIGPILLDAGLAASTPSGLAPSVPAFAASNVEVASMEFNGAPGVPREFEGIEVSGVHIGSQRGVFLSKNISPVIARPTYTMCLIFSREGNPAQKLEYRKRAKKN